MPIRVKTVGTSLCIVFSVKDLKQVLIVIFITSNIFFFGLVWIHLKSSGFIFLLLLQTDWGHRYYAQITKTHYLFDPFRPLCSDMMPPCCLKNQFRQKGAVSGSAMEEWGGGGCEADAYFCIDYKIALLHTVWHWPLSSKHSTANVVPTTIIIKTCVSLNLIPSRQG